MFLTENIVLIVSNILIVKSIKTGEISIHVYRINEK